jgi:hypothetical protein
MDVELDGCAGLSNMYLGDVPSAIRFVSAKPLLGTLRSQEANHLDREPGYHRR